MRQTDTGAENDCDKNTYSKNFEVSRFCKRTINHQSNDSLAFQQHTSGQFNAIKPVKIVYVYTWSVSILYLETCIF